jgi:DNA-binding transcriptional ArsR family regulator
MGNLDRIMKGLSSERRKKIEPWAAQLIAEEMTWQKLRRARKLTQVQLAKTLDIGQEWPSTGT